MASFADCIRSARAQGFKMSDEEADALIARYEEHRQARAAAGDRDPEGAAKTALVAEKEQEAATKLAIANGQKAAADRIKQYLQEFRDFDGNPNVFQAFGNLIESYGKETTSIKNQAMARTNMTFAEMSDFITTFRRSFISPTGKRLQKPQMENVIREMRGESTGDVEAKGMADAANKAVENTRLTFNEKAGYEAIGKLDYGYLPQNHNAAALLRAPGKTAAAKFKVWFDDELPNLDLDKMRDPLTGGPLTPERLEEGMRVAWNRIVTGGWSDKKPTAASVGAGALAKQRSDHRWIHYKTGDGWLASNKKYGDGDPFNAIVSHIRSINHDIATMDVLGPNPTATAEWMKQVIQSEVAKNVIGEPSLHAGKADNNTGDRLANRFQQIYDSAAGPAIISGRVATAAGDVSNVLTAAYLGSTGTLAAVTDPFIDRTARYLNGLPATKALWGVLHNIQSWQTRAQLVRSGLGLDDALFGVTHEARYSGMLGGHNWSRLLADRAVHWNGLAPLTQTRKHQFGRDWQAQAADHVGDTWDELGNKNAYFRRAMENYGLEEKDWNALRKTELFIPAEGSAGFLQPSDVKNKDLGIRYLEMILGETERAVPTGSMRAKSIVTGNLARGTVFGELLNSTMQFKSFTMSFQMLQWQAMQMELQAGRAVGGTFGAVARGAGYAAALMIPLTLGGATYLQIRNLLDGKDLQPMDPFTGQGAKFWMQAMFKGGGLGLIGDFMFNDLTQYGNTPVSQIEGPTISLLSDAIGLTVGNAQKAIQGQKTHFGRELVRKGARNVPIISSHPFTKSAYQRMIIDQLQYLTDPEAHKYFKDQQSRLRRNTGQGYFWPPGATSPERAPQFSSARK